MTTPAGTERRCTSSIAGGAGRTTAGASRSAAGEGKPQQPPTPSPEDALERGLEVTVEAALLVTARNLVTLADDLHQSDERQSALRFHAETLIAIAQQLPADLRMVRS
jgi:hypothetical protein